jgi:signal transduction histidine kinase
MIETRILIVDDNPRIHEDFAKIFEPRRNAALDDLAADLFDEEPTKTEAAYFTLHHALQGAEAVELVRTSGPFAVAFVDMRMPPGIDGLETIERMWEIAPDLQVVICSAYSDHTWTALRERLGQRDGLLVMRKPFDPIEALQAAHALAGKWHTAAQLRRRVDELEVLNAHLVRIARLATKGELAAGIAHEIATPVMYLGANLDVVRELSTANDKELPEVIESMREGVSSITSIIRSMRELSHPGHRDPRPADLNRALATALELAASAYKSSAKLERDLGELPPVTCHVSELHQVFVNLLVNAGHAMAGTTYGTLTIRSRVDGRDVVVSVTDTGGGIPEELRHRVFEPFFTTKDVGEGTGQGLAIAHAIVTRHQGTLTYETELGRGTTFHVRLPIAGPPTSAERAA